MEAQGSLTWAGGAALLGVDFGVPAVDNTLHLSLGDDAFLSQKSSFCSVKRLLPHV